MCCYSGEFFSFQSQIQGIRIGINAWLALEVIIFSVLIFKDFYDDKFDKNFVDANCGSPFSAIFVLILFNMHQIGNFWNVFILTCVRPPGYSEQDQYAKHLQCVDTIYVSVSYGICAAFRFWPFGLWIWYLTDFSKDYCYSDRIMDSLYVISIVQCLVMMTFLIYGIVMFFIWCPLATKKCQEAARKAKLEHEKETNAIKVRELERIAEEAKQQLKEVTHERDMIVSERDEFKSQINEAIPVEHVAISIIDDNVTQIAAKSLINEMLDENKE